MPTTLLITFPPGQHRDTASDPTAAKPPSPWRLLRLLHATWRTRAPHLDDATVHALLARLAEPPVFYHHPHELGISWPFQLPDDHHATLARLATSIPYWEHPTDLCHAQLVSRWQPTHHEVWIPLDVATAIDPRSPATAVLAPLLPLRWESLGSHEITASAGSMPIPVGAHLIGYQHTLAASEQLVSEQHCVAAAPTTVRFELAVRTAPPATAALAYTDLLRQAALSKLGTVPPGRTTCLNGKTSAGTAMTQQHQHAHYLPLIHQAHLTGLVIWSPSGFTERELAALSAITGLRSNGHIPIRAAVHITNLGTIRHAAPELAPTTPAATWQSLTPFIPARYPKRHQHWNDFLHAEISRELSYRTPEHLPLRNVTLTSQPWRPWIRHRPSTQYRPHRHETPRAGAFLRLDLARPHCGPLALGELSHFGIGLFGTSGPLGR